MRCYGLTRFFDRAAGGTTPSPSGLKGKAKDNLKPNHQETDDDDDEDDEDDEMDEDEEEDEGEEVSFLAYPFIRKINAHKIINRNFTKSIPVSFFRRGAGLEAFELTTLQRRPLKRPDWKMKAPMTMRTTR
jgi:hypothetical protein